jgi:hypothetical protein
MAVYYFDFREGDELVVDEEGMELIGIGAAQNEAARSLAGIAWDAMRSDGAQLRCETCMDLLWKLSSSS